MESDQKFESLFESLMNLKPILQGSLSKQYKICGKANCRCMDKENPQKHVCYQLSYRVNNKAATMYVNQKNADTVKEMTDSYKELRSIIVKLGEESIHLVKEHKAEKAKEIIETSMAKVKAKVTGCKTSAIDIRKLKDSTENWKNKAISRKKELDKNSVKIRDLTKSRDNWREKQNELKKENDILKKKLEIITKDNQSLKEELSESKKN